MRRQRGLTPIELQSGVLPTKNGGGISAMQPDAQQAKIIRFYGSGATDRKAMTLSREQLEQAGFVAYAYHGAKDPKTLKFERLANETILVHRSLGVSPSAGSYLALDFGHPHIEYIPGYGWEGRYGALRYNLRTENDLHRFLTQFDYV